MDRKEFFTVNNSFHKSLLVLMTDGEPTDDYEKPFQDLLNNPYYNNSNRFTIGIGNEYDESLLTRFAGKKKVFTLPDDCNNHRLSRY